VEKYIYLWLQSKTNFFSFKLERKMNLYFTNLIHFSSQNFDQRRQVLRIFTNKSRYPMKKEELFMTQLHPLSIDETNFLPYNGWVNEDGTSASILFNVSSSILKRMTNNVKLTTLILMGNKKYSFFTRFRIGKRRYIIYNYIHQRNRQEFIDLFSICKFLGLGRKCDDIFCRRENKRGEIYLCLINNVSGYAET
jgi:hypothetical protein